MPVYDYQCAACGRRFEVVHGVHAEGPTSCPLCGKGPVRKAITAAAVHYKGSGWAKKERRASVTSGAAKATEGSSSADEGKVDPGDSNDAGDGTGSKAADKKTETKRDEARSGRTAESGASKASPSKATAAKPKD